MKLTKTEKEIIYNIINSLLAGGLVFLGGLSAGQMTWTTVGAAGLAAGIVALTKFREYWAGSSFKPPKSKKAQLFCFI